MKTVKDIEEASRQVLMAGLGICGLGKDYAVHKLDVLMEDLNGLVNSLLLKGEQVEDDLHINERVQAIKDRRIARIRKKLGFNSDPQLSELDQLSHKLDMLTKVVDKLAEQKAQKQQEPANAQKTAAQKTEVKTETLAKKPAVRKTTAAKATAIKSTATKSTAAKSTRAKVSSTTPTKTATGRKSTNASQSDTGADS